MVEHTFGKGEIVITYAIVLVFIDAVDYVPRACDASPRRCIHFEAVRRMYLPPKSLSDIVVLTKNNTSELQCLGRKLSCRRN